MQSELYERHRAWNTESHPQSSTGNRGCPSHQALKAVHAGGEETRTGPSAVNQPCTMVSEHKLQPCRKWLNCSMLDSQALNAEVRTDLLFSSLPQPPAVRLQRGR